MPAIAQTKKPLSALGILAEVDVVLDRHKKDLAQQIASPLEEKTRSILTSLGIKNPNQNLVNQIASATTKNTIDAAGEIQDSSDFSPILAKKFTDAALANPDVSQKISDPLKIYDAAQKETADIVDANSRDFEAAAVLTGLSEIARLENPTPEIAETISSSTEDLARIQAPLTSPQNINDLKSQIFEYTSAYPQNLTQELSSFSAENLPTLNQLQKAKEAAHAKTVAEMKLPKIDSRININEIINQIGTQLRTTSTSAPQSNFGLPSKKTGITETGMKLMLNFSSGAQKEAYFSLLAYDKNKLEKAISNNPNTTIFKDAQNFAIQKPQKLTRYLTYFQNTYGLGNSSFIIWESTGQMLTGASTVSPKDIPQKALGVLSSTNGSISGIRGAMNAAKLLKAGTTAAKATNPAGWVMLAAQFAPQLINLLKKAAAALAGILGWLLFTYGLKFLGALAGAIAGAGIGATIGFFVGGPAGAVIGGAIGAATGAAIGWLQPLETINFVRNPSLIVTAPANFIQGIFSSIGSGAASLGSSLIGATSALWGAATSAVGASIGAIGSGISSLLSGLSAASVSGTTIFVPLAIGTGAIGIGSVILGIFTGSAFFSTSSEGTPGIVPGQNEFYSITKTASPGNISNQSPGQTQNVIFTINLTAKNLDLTNIQISDSTKDQKGSQSTSINKDASGNDIAVNCPKELAAGKSCQAQITIGVTSDFTDSLISNIVSVKATPAGQPEKQDSATAFAVVGNPPLNCPTGWPTKNGYITQGPTGYPDHHLLYPQEQSIDIGVNTGTPAFSTFSGIVSDIEDQGHLHYGLYIDIQGNCNGKTFTARWAHMNSISGGLSIGTTVSFGQQIGYTDNTGNSTGPHLHYSFFGLEMKTPFIPKDIIPLNCGDSPGQPCNLSW